MFLGAYETSKFSSFLVVKIARDSRRLVVGYWLIKWYQLDMNQKLFQALTSQRSWTRSLMTQSENPSSHDMCESKLYWVSFKPDRGPRTQKDSKQKKTKPRAVCKIYFQSMVIIFQRKNLNDALLNRHKLLIVKFDENENTVRKKVEKHHTNPTNNNHKSFNFIKSRRDLKYLTQIFRWNIRGICCK